MTQIRLDDCPDMSPSAEGASTRVAGGPPAPYSYFDASTSRAAANIRSTGPRRTPRISVIVVLPDNHILSAERLAQRLPSAGEQDVDIIVACAGQPAELGSLHRAARGAQFLLAPAGTSEADLRELAMSQAPGDIVTLLSGALHRTMPAAERELLQSS